MVDDATEHEAPTRRDYMTYGGAVIGGGLLAGCTGSTGSNSTSTTGNQKQSDKADSATPEDTSYSVTMAPVGTVEFSAVPENVMVYSLLYADMAVAYGHGNAVNSLGFDAEAGGNTLDAYYERLSGVSFDRDGLTQLNTGEGVVDNSVFSMSEGPPLS